MSNSTLTLNGNTCEAHAGESLLDLAKRLGIDIPHLCHKPGLRPDGNCRACVVEVAGERTLAASCCRAATPGMVVQTDSPRAIKSQQMVLEMLLSDMPSAGYQWNDGDANSPHGELSQWAERLDVAVRPALQNLQREQAKPDVSHPACSDTSHPAWHDESHPAMAVNLDACINCRRCERACREVQVNGGVRTARLCSTSPIPWGRVHAWLAANVCRPAPRGRSAPKRSSARKRWTSPSIPSAPSAALAAS